MKCMFLAKRGRSDVLTGVSVLSTRVLTSNEDDWNELTRLPRETSKCDNFRKNCTYYFFLVRRVFNFKFFLSVFDKYN